MEAYKKKYQQHIVRTIPGMIEVWLGAHSLLRFPRAHNHGPVVQCRIDPPSPNALFVGCVS